MKKKTAEKQNKKRAEKRKKIIMETQARRMTRAKQQQAVDNANKVRADRQMELAGLAIIFKILNGRDVNDKDKFTAESLGQMCQDFLDKHKKMDEKEKAELQPLVPLAEKKVELLKRYREVNRRLIEEQKEKEKLEKKEEIKKEKNKAQ